jgi:hypothetical protein
MTDKLPAAEGSGREPSPSNFHVVILNRLHHHIGELELSLSALPSAQHSSVTFTVAIEALADCQSSLCDVLQDVIELNASYGLSPVPAVDIDAVIQWCNAVRRQLDGAFMALVSANAGALLMS